MRSFHVAATGRADAPIMPHTYKLKHALIVGSGLAAAATALLFAGSIVPYVEKIMHHSPADTVYSETLLGDATLMKAPALSIR